MATYSKVVVVGAKTIDTPMFDQVEQKLLLTVAANPRFELAPGAEFVTESVQELPAETKAAVEGFIWSLQTRHERRGGAWQVDFFDPLGFSFMVCYLE